MMTNKPHKRGFTLSEVLITLSIIGILATSIAVFCLNSRNHQNVDEKQLSETTTSVGNVFEAFGSEKGLIPQAISPLSLLISRLDIQSKQSVSVVPAGCSTVLPATQLVLPRQTVYVSNQWVNNTTNVCVQQNHLTRTLKIKRSGEIDKSNTLASSEQSQQLANGTQYNSSSAIQKTVSTPFKSQFTMPAVVTPKLNTLNLNLSFEGAVLRSTPVKVTVNGEDKAASVGTNTPVSFSKLPPSIYGLKIEGNDIKTVNQVLDLSNSSLSKSYLLETKRSALHLYGFLNRDHIFSAFDEVNNNNIIAELYQLLIEMPIKRYYWPGSAKQHSMSADYYYTVDSETGEKSETNPQIVQKSIIDSQEHKANKGYAVDANGNIYKLLELFTPLKIALDGKNAAMNSDENFMLDIDGFNHADIPPVKTSGGLNVNEAWLIYDGNGNGSWKNQSIDNDDLFGDHLGLIDNGYINIVNVFQNDIKLDEQANPYIELDDGLWVKFKVWWKRLWGDKTPCASTDLKLLTITREELLAASVMKRFYVNYKNVNEYDDTKHNAIFQRAKVLFKNGKIAESADQYYSIDRLIARKASAEEIRALKAKGGINKLPQIP